MSDTCGHFHEASDNEIAAICEKAVSDAAEEYNEELRRMKSGEGIAEESSSSPVGHVKEIDSATSVINLAK